MKTNSFGEFKINERESIQFDSLGNNTKIILLTEDIKKFGGFQNYCSLKIKIENDMPCYINHLLGNYIASYVNDRLSSLNQDNLAIYPALDIHYLSTSHLSNEKRIFANHLYITVESDDNELYIIVNNIIDSFSGDVHSASEKVKATTFIISLIAKAMTSKEMVLFNYRNGATGFEAKQLTNIGKHPVTTYSEYNSFKKTMNNDINVITYELLDTQILSNKFDSSDYELTINNCIQNSKITFMIYYKHIYDYKIYADDFIIESIRVALKHYTKIYEKPDITFQWQKNDLVQYTKSTIEKITLKNNSKYFNITSKEAIKPATFLTVSDTDYVHLLINYLNKRQYKSEINFKIIKYYVHHYLMVVLQSTLIFTCVLAKDIEKRIHSRDNKRCIYLAMLNQSNHYLLLENIEKTILKEFSHDTNFNRAVLINELYYFITNHLTKINNIEFQEMTLNLIQKEIEHIITENKLITVENAYKKLNVFIFKKEGEVLC